MHTGRWLIQPAPRSRRSPGGRAAALACLLLLALLAALSPASAASKATLWRLEEPTPPAAAQPAPPAAEPPPGGPSAFPGEPADDRVIIEHADQFEYDQGVSRLQGDVRLRTPRYLLSADQAELDDQQEWVTLSGGIDLRAEAFEAKGSLLRVNRKSGQWRAEEDVWARVEPEFFEGGQVAEPLFLQARQGGAPAEEGPIALDWGELTSCDRADHRHYFFHSRHVEVRPGRELIAERPVINFFGRDLFQLPFDLVLWLDERRNQFLPEVGQNDVEGYYAKFAFGYLLSQIANGFVRLNLTEKRGIGLGAEQYLKSDRADGLASVMYEPSQGSLTSRLQLGYDFSREWSTDLSGSYQSNSGYFGNTSSLVTSLLLSQRSAAGQMQLGYQRSTTASSYSDSSRDALNLTRRERFGQYGSWSVRANWESFSYGLGEPREQLDTDFELNQRAGSFDLSLLASQLFELDRADTTSARYATNRLPVLSVRTDNERLPGLRILGGTPFQLELMAGEWEQQPDDFNVFRSGYEVTLGGERKKWGERSEGRLSTRLRQLAYSDGSAQWLGQLDFDWRYNFGRDWDQRLRFAHQEHHGFAPLSLDFAGRQDSLSYQLVQSTTDHTRLEFSTGYDFVGDFWQDALVRAEWMPTRHTKLSLQGGYSLERSEWRPLGIIWTQAALPDFYLSLASQYDFRGTGVTRASLELDWRLSEQWAIAMVSGYSGYSRELDTLDIGLYRDLHCMTASLTYSQARDEIVFNLGIKAFPGRRQVLGIGRGGQQFQALPGQYY